MEVHNIEPPISYKDYIDHNIIHGKPSRKHPFYGGIGKMFFDCITRNGDKIAQTFGPTGESETYSSLKLRSIRVALAMQSRGIKPGDVITICSLNHLDVCLPFIAALYTGALVASTDPSLTVSDNVHLLSQVSPKMIFCDADSVPLIEQTLEQSKFISTVVVFGGGDIVGTKHVPFSEFLKELPEEKNFSPVLVEDERSTALIHFSSGSTGFPKGISLSHRSYLYREIYRNKDFSDADCVLSFASFYWISTTVFLTMCIFQGGRRIVCPNFDPTIVLQYYSDYKVTLGFLAPSQAVAVIRHGRTQDIDTSQLKLVQVAGGPVTENQLVKLRDLLPGTCVYSPYGQTEGSAYLLGFFVTLPDSKRFMMEKINSCGQPLIGLSYKVVDLETGKSLGVGKSGELLVKSNFLMNGYYQQDSSDRWDAEGWLHTGDVVYYDEDHCFFVVDRIKDMLKFQSWHVVPSALEAVLYKHPAVREAVVVGIPHEEDGDHPLAIVTLAENYPENVLPEDIEKWVRDRVHDRERLRGGVRIYKNIPKTPTGKFRRRALRDMIIADIKSENQNGKTS